MYALLYMCFLLCYFIYFVCVFSTSLYSNVHIVFIFFSFACLWCTCMFNIIINLRFGVHTFLPHNNNVVVYSMGFLHDKYNE